jgi:hypothetical protein
MLQVDKQKLDNHNQNLANAQNQKGLMLENKTRPSP